MTQPNFLIIMSDEHDPRVSEPYGHPFVRTPTMRRLADRGGATVGAVPGPLGRRSSVLPPDLPP